VEEPKTIHFAMVLTTKVQILNLFWLFLNFSRKSNGAIVEIVKTFLFATILTAICPAISQNNFAD
jgi:hypothetical protein